MNKLKNKILFLSIFLVLMSVSGVLVLTTRTLVKDKENSIADIAALLIPSVSASIEKNIMDLNREIVRSTGTTWRTSSIAEMTVNLKNISHLLQLTVKQKNKIILSFSREHTFSLTNINNVNSKSFMIETTERNDALRVIFTDDDRHYDAVFSKTFLNKSLSTNRAILFSLIDCNNNIPLISTSIDFGELNCSDIHLQNQQVQIINNGSQSIYALSSIGTSANIYLVGYIPFSKAQALAEILFKDIWFFAILILLFAVLASYMISHRLVVPLEALVTATARLSQGEWKINIPFKGNDEVSRLIQSFSQMGIELEKRENELMTANQVLLKQEKLAVLGRFSAGMAHEIKNPLNTIMNFTELLLRQPDLKNSKHTESIDYILKETKRVNKIISDLMSFSRQKTLVKENIILNELLMHAYNLQKLEAEKLHINFSVNTIDAAIVVAGDHEQLLQVLLNLTTNAFHALEGQPNPCVALAAEVSPQRIIISVLDNGVGISPENLAKIFDPFFTTKGIGKGTGLGLALCYGIAKEHSAELVVESQENKGTVFKLIFNR